MTLNDFKTTVDFGLFNTENYNFYVVSFAEMKTYDEFYQHCNDNLPQLSNLYCFKVGNTFYIALDKEITVPENFGDSIIVVSTEIPESLGEE
jgi:hypothetical protein